MDEPSKDDWPTGIGIFIELLRPAEDGNCIFIVGLRPNKGMENEPGRSRAARPGEHLRDIAQKDVDRTVRMVSGAILAPGVKNAVQ